LEQDELYAAALLLHAAARRDTAVQEKLAEKMGERKTVRVLWALAKLRFILPRAHALLLTTRGEAFLAGKPEEAL
jgi:hypothetical protein